MKYYDDIGQLVGKTPLVRINRLNPNPNALILAKIEKLNPGGSVKDRIAKNLIESAERDGLLSSDKTIIEPTSGNTGIGIAMIAALKGYRCELVMPESMSEERRRIMESYGALVTLTPAEDGVDGAINYVKRKLWEEPDRYYSPNQYDNPNNWLTHVHTTAVEIMDDTDGRVTHFVAGLGTSGTLMGVGRGLKRYIPDMQVVSVEPENNSFIPGLKDLDVAQIPGIFDEAILDRRIRVSSAVAEQTMRSLSLEEGIFVGISAGAAMAGALQIAREINKKDTLIVVLFPDSGERYLSTGATACCAQGEASIKAKVRVEQSA